MRSADDGDAAMAQNYALEITTYLSSNHMPPSPIWLSNFIDSIRANTPLPALKKTALFRIQAADLTTSIAPDSSINLFPANVAEATVKETKVRGSIVVQVLDVEDLGRSRWSQVEALEAQKRGETTKGREIIRVVENDADEDDSSSRTRSGIDGNAKSGPHKLLLQDARGTIAYGIELRAVAGVGLQMSIGAKLLLKNVVLARGVLLLTPDTAEVLGGKVEAWDKTWREERLANLKAKANAAGD